MKAATTNNLVVNMLSYQTKKPLSIFLKTCQKYRNKKYKNKYKKKYKKKLIRTTTNLDTKHIVVVSNLTRNQKKKKELKINNIYVNAES